MQRGIGGIGKIVERVQQGSVKIEDGGVAILSNPLYPLCHTQAKGTGKTAA